MPEDQTGTAGIWARLWRVALWGLLASGSLLLVSVIALVIATPFTRGRRVPPEEAFARAKPAVGDAAPDFTLRSPGGDEFRLSAWRHRRPVVLEFGSFT
jgi:hypothetical protein